ILAPETPGEAVELLGLQLGAGHVLRLRIEDSAVLVDQVARPGLEKRFAASFHVLPLLWLLHEIDPRPLDPRLRIGKFRSIAKTLQIVQKSRQCTACGG